jgi:hypothetical protein
MNRPLPWLIGWMAAALCLTAGAPAQEPVADQEEVAGPALDPVPDGRALVYLFNGSGKTLIGNAYDFELDDRRIAKLARMKYTALSIEPGPHRLEAAVRKLDFTANAGQRHFVFLAYRPGKSWAFPLGGDPVVLREISEQDALDILPRFEREPAEQR